MRARWLLPLLVGLLAPVSCTNDPYPPADAGRKIYYAAFSQPPKTLDPAVAYSVVDHEITGPVYETLLEYHFLARPYRLIPGIAREVPEPEPQADGRVRYRFRLRPDLRFHRDPCFELGGEGLRTRAVVAADVAFELMRIADPDVNSPVFPNFLRFDGMAEFRDSLEARRAASPEFAALRIDRQYAEAGGVRGLVMPDPLTLDVHLAEPYPQIRYWFATEFTTPVPWEAIEYYDGEEGRESFSEHPVGAGPYRLVEYNKRSRIALEADPDWYGVRHPEWQAPAAIYPSDGAPGDRARGHLDPAYVGRPLPFIERIELRIEKERIPAFTKFLQGYYDASGVVEESFDTVIQNDDLSAEMREMGMQLEKSVSPDVYYLGFNMLDPTVGEEAAERGRKLRQAMSLVVDAEEFTRIFTNGRGIPAQSPLPPGIFGHDDGYRNPFRSVDEERARELLAEAGYAGGIDP